MWWVAPPAPGAKVAMLSSPYASELLADVAPDATDEFHARLAQAATADKLPPVPCDMVCPGCRVELIGAGDSVSTLFGKPDPTVPGDTCLPVWRYVGGGTGVFMGLACPMASCIETTSMMLDATVHACGLADTGQPCRTCGKPTEKRCSACTLVHYCDAVCQRADWPNHKKACRVVSQQ